MREPTHPGVDVQDILVPGGFRHRRVSGDDAACACRPGPGKVWNDSTRSPSTTASCIVGSNPTLSAIFQSVHTDGGQDVR